MQWLSRVADGPMATQGEAERDRYEAPEQGLLQIEHYLYWSGFQTDQFSRRRSDNC